LSLTDKIGDVTVHTAFVTIAFCHIVFNKDLSI